METTSHVNEEEKGNGKPGTYQGGEEGGRGGTDWGDRGIETDVLNGKGEEAGREGEEAR